MTTVTVDIRELASGRLAMTCTTHTTANATDKEKERMTDYAEFMRSLIAAYNKHHNEDK